MSMMIGRGNAFSLINNKQPARQVGEHEQMTERIGHSRYGYAVGVRELIGALVDDLVAALEHELPHLVGAAVRHVDIRSGRGRRRAC